MPGSQAPIYRPPNRRQAKQPQPHPRATARVPTPLHATPALTKTTKKDELFRVFVRAGVVRTRGWDPCGRPGGWVEAYLAVALAMVPALAPCPCGRPGVGHSPPAQHANLTPIGPIYRPPVLFTIPRFMCKSASSACLDFRSPVKHSSMRLRVYLFNHFQ